MKMFKIAVGWFSHPLLRIQVNVDDYLQNGTTHLAGCGDHRYYTDMTNPATGIAENDDRCLAVLVMTDDCQVGWQICW